MIRILIVVRIRPVYALVEFLPAHECHFVGVVFAVESWIDEVFWCCVVQLAYG